MHGSSCPKCGAASDGAAKACGSCGAVRPSLTPPCFFSDLIRIDPIIIPYTNNPTHTHTHS